MFDATSNLAPSKIGWIKKHVISRPDARITET